MSKGSPVTSGKLNLSMIRDRMIALIFPPSSILNQARIGGGIIRAERTLVLLGTLMDARIGVVSKGEVMTRRPTRVEPATVRLGTLIDAEETSPVPKGVGETTNIIVATGKIKRAEARVDEPVGGAPEESRKVEEVVAMTRAMGNSTLQMRVLLRLGEVEGARMMIDGCMPSTILIVREK